MGEEVPVAGRVIGRYALHAEIATGGLASVHLGRRVGVAGSGSTVAIKRLRPQYAHNAEFVAMFMEEARVARLLQHPNIVSVVDVVAFDGELFLVLDYVLGESLARLAHASHERGEHVPPAILAAISIGLLDGLHAAHDATDERGTALAIVHRDVSPENVVVGADGVARVLDFGIAKAIDRALPTTRLGGLKGKMAYMAPEQITGRTIDRRADLWSASVVLWELLARRRLFAEDSHQGLLRMILEEAPRAPSLVAPCTPAFDAIVLRGLAKEPEARFSTAREMALAIAAAAEPASPRVVARWVADHAADVLRARRAVVAELEGASDTPRAGPPREATPPAGALPEEATGVARGRVASRAPPAIVVPPPIERAAVDFAPNALSLHGAPRRPRRKERAPVRLRSAGLLLGGGALVLLLMLGVRWQRDRRPPTAAAGPTSATESIPDLPSDVAAAGLGGETPSTSSATSASAASASPPRLRYRPVSAPRPACDPPYNVGPPPDFIRTPKPQCFSR